MGLRNGANTATIIGQKKAFFSHIYFA